MTSRTSEGLETVFYRDDLNGINWQALKDALAADHFDNGRSPEQLEASFKNSHRVCIAWFEDQIVGTSRVISDGVCNAYLVDLWTKSDFRRQGIATEMASHLMHALSGQHLYLQADETLVEFYRRLGFAEQPVGMSRVVGTWLAINNRLLKDQRMSEASQATSAITTRDSTGTERQKATRWYHMVAYFFGGVFLANTIPHLVNGMSGLPFQSPFASPPGKGLSSSTVNVLWGMFNLAVGYVLVCRVGQFNLRRTSHVVIAGLGALLIALQLARHFGELHGGNL